MAIRARLRRTADLLVCWQLSRAVVRVGDDMTPDRRVVWGKLLAGFGA